MIQLQNYKFNCLHKRHTSTESNSAYGDDTNVYFNFFIWVEQRTKSVPTVLSLLTLIMLIMIHVTRTY